MFCVEIGAQNPNKRVNKCVNTVWAVIQLPLDNRSHSSRTRSSNSSSSNWERLSQTFASVHGLNCQRVKSLIHIAILTECTRPTHTRIKKIRNLKAPLHCTYEQSVRWYNGQMWQSLLKKVNHIHESCHCQSDHKQNKSTFHHWMCIQQVAEQCI